ncbi:MAG: acyltransferase family protein [Anaerolineae bacterium]|nr:acyltransferase family protein [Anaerolineae bacterium]
MASQDKLDGELEASMQDMENPLSSNPPDGDQGAQALDRSGGNGSAPKKKRRASSGSSGAQKRVAKKTTGKKSARGKSTRAARPRARERIAFDPELFELPDVQEELLADPSLQRRSRQLGQELVHQVELVIKRLMRLSPAYKTQLAVPAGMHDAIGDNIESALEGSGGTGLVARFQKLLPGEMIDLDTLRGMWTMLKFTGEYQADVVKRRLRGEYETDEWGMDQEFIDAVIPLFDFLYHKYWRVTLNGVENIPEDGRALLVSNHSGQLPFDGAMLLLGILQQHAAARFTRALYASWFPTLPFVSDLLVKVGQVMANDENALRLLEQEHLVAVFPEGYKGAGKLYKDRYHLARFGRGGFVKVALKSRAPLIPVAVVGAEETYISLHKSATLAKLIGFPYFPISPTFPWLGPLGLIPLPTKWYIDIGEPIPTDQYPEGSENNLMLVSQLTDRVRDTVQEMINDRLRTRKSIFKG